MTEITEINLTISAVLTCFNRGFETCRSPPVLISGTGKTVILIPTVEQKCTVFATGSMLITLFIGWAQGRPGPALSTLTLTSLTEQPAILRITLTTSDGRKGGPLCAEGLNHRGYPKGYPTVIQSFTLYLPGRRSNSAQSGSPFITPLGKGGALCASYPKLFSSLSPGPRSSVPRPAGDVQRVAG